MTATSFRLACEVAWDDVATAHAGGEPLIGTERVQTLVAVALHEAGARAGEDIELGVRFVGADTIAALNGEHRGVEGPTDVLAFPMDGLVEELRADMPRQLGDVVACPPYVERQVQEGRSMLPHGPGQGEGDRTLVAALERCVVHGVLHLAGFDHERGAEAAREMFDLEQLVLDRVGGT